MCYGLENRGQEGYHNGKVPFGYRRPAYPIPPEDAPTNWKPPRMPARIDPETFPALVWLGELVAVGWSDAAIADELAGQGITSKTPRFGTRALTKDTIASIRRTWFPSEFSPGSGKGTIETPSGELVEGKHPAAWPYALWRRMIEAKRSQYHRPTREAQRRAHEFSRIIVWALTSVEGVVYGSEASRRLRCIRYMLDVTQRWNKPQQCWLRRTQAINLRSFLVCERSQRPR